MSNTEANIGCEAIDLDEADIVDQVVFVIGYRCIFFWVVRITDILHIETMQLTCTA